MTIFLNEFSDRVKALFDSIHNPIIAIDTDGRVSACNRAGEKVLGLDPDSIVGRDLTTLIHDSRLFKTLKSGKQELTQKIEIGGHTFTSNRTIIRVKDDIIGAVAVLQDISELESISEELEHTKRISAELGAIIESSFDGIYVTDGKAKTLRVNSAYERITGIKRDEVIGRTMHDLVAEGYFNESVTLKVLETRSPTSLVQKIKTGKVLMVTGNPFFDEQENIDLVVTNVRDVSELHRLQEQLETSEKQRLEVEVELRQLRGTLHRGNKIVLRSKKMQDLSKTALRLSHVESTVLIQGASGVGKEIFADLIHDNGPRRDKPFIKINCAAFPDQLLDSELFGYAPGAFTGAHKQGKIGLFEAAQGGSLFLDEFGEMPLKLQVKLLRVLQEREIYRIGDTHPIKVDVRIIAATNRDLEQMVSDKSLREDLFFRINVVRLIVPSLKERPEDILPLIYHFLEKYNHQYRLSKQIDQQVISQLLTYDWPGNVRELENLVEQLVVITPGEIITQKNLPDHWGYETNLSHLSSIGHRSLVEIMDDVERSLLTQVMQQHKTTRKAADILKVNQSTIVRKLKRHGIKP
ncbi:MAG: sigma 54-interacting transcriptional regulator [Proteobacteria bacterium]|nr:sigma 54-interacting transcriptional regulator [Pseudomonadota bacterium]